MLQATRDFTALVWNQGVGPCPRFCCCCRLKYELFVDKHDKSSWPNKCLFTFLKRMLSAVTWAFLGWCHNPLFFRFSSSVLNGNLLYFIACKSLTPLNFCIFWLLFGVFNHSYRLQLSYPWKFGISHISQISLIV